MFILNFLLLQTARTDCHFLPQQPNYGLPPKVFRKFPLLANTYNGIFVTKIVSLHMHTKRPPLLLCEKCGITMDDKSGPASENKYKFGWRQLECFSNEWPVNNGKSATWVEVEEKKTILESRWTIKDPSKCLFFLFKRLCRRPSFFNTVLTEVHRVKGWSLSPLFGVAVDKLMCHLVSRTSCIEFYHLLSVEYESKHVTDFLSLSACALITLSYTTRRL